MPWTVADVPGKTRKAKTAKQRRQWVEIANAELKKHGDEKRAIMAANGVIAKGVAKGKGKR